MRFSWTCCRRWEWVTLPPPHCRQLPPPAQAYLFDPVQEPAIPSGSILTARDLTLAEPPLGPLDLGLRSGEITILAGPSGGGKSRLLRALADLDAPAGGTVALHGRPAADYPAPDYRRAVAYQLPTPLLGTGTVSGLLERVQGLEGRDRAAAVEDGLRRLGLPETVLGRAAGELSTGEALRVTLALLLSGHPEVLLLDEPTGPLDPQATARVEAWIREQAEAGAAVLWTSHDPAQAARMGHELLYLENGRLHGPEHDPEQFPAIMERLDRGEEDSPHAG